MHPHTMHEKGNNLNFRYKLENTLLSKGHIKTRQFIIGKPQEISLYPEIVYLFSLSQYIYINNLIHCELTSQLWLPQKD